MYKIINLLIKIFHNYFELTILVSSLLIIFLAIIMDSFLSLQACPLCILTRYVFLLISISAAVGLFTKKNIGKYLIILSSLIGLFVTSRQIYIQNMSIEQITELSGCSMPFHTQIDYFGLIEAVKNTISGGPSCAEDGLRLILNFAEWGFLFFFIYLTFTLLKLRNS